MVDERGYVHHLDIVPPSLGSSSRSASPSPSPSPQPPLIPIPAALQPHAGQPHPLPPIPIQHQPNFAQAQPLLALPPPAPQGPRSPGLVLHRSHTPSPERGGFTRPYLHAAVPNHSAPPVSGAALNGGASKPALGIVTSRKDGEDKDRVGDEEGDDIRTPIRPSAKALGKRRVVEAEEPDRKSNSLSISLIADVCATQQRTRSIPTTFSTSALRFVIRGILCRTIVG